VAPKRSGKEVASSSGGPQAKKKAPAENHGIQFQDNTHRDRYKVLTSKPLHPCQYPDSHRLNMLGIRDNVYKLLGNLG
jgi:hypothetical protein